MESNTIGYSISKPALHLNSQFPGQNILKLIKCLVMKGGTNLSLDPMFFSLDSIGFYNEPSREIVSRTFHTILD